MKNIHEYKLYYFLGIGGIGMSALARYFKLKNKIVVGYDKTKSELTLQLEKEGMDCHYEENIEHLLEKTQSFSKEDILVIYTPAIPQEHSELRYFQSHHFNIKKRSEVLGEIVNQYHCIAIAGTHGKTTTTALITHIFYQAQQNIIAFVGGIMSNYQTNFIYRISNSKDPVFSITEADEYDKSFLKLHPETAVITSIDPDHLDIYQTHQHLIDTYVAYAGNIKDNGTLIVNKSVDKFFSNTKNIITFAVNLKGQIAASNLNFQNNKMLFDLHINNQTFKQIELGIPGQHNVMNALAAIAVARQYQIPFETIFAALQSFKGVKRRFEYHIKNENVVLIDDYAHHPEEIKAFLQSVKTLYPNKKITAVFQPHLYSRTRDFMDEFANVLSQYSDEIILLDIYPAREKPIENITSKTLLNKINHPNKKLLHKSELADYLNTTHQEIILTIGAGDIELLIPKIKEKLIPKCN
ncbi:MAG: UDP-N-acetylmuramate--L-alanine ligase [Bacteroidia bacterium]|nr:MAG: UDP-N-acetylmuramate--L-alanine ligase [Bacteroidia bacterium]